MQRRVAQHSKDRAHDSQSHHVIPQSQHVEAKRAQNRAARNLDVEAVLVVDEREVAHFVDDQAFEAEVEDGELWKTLALGSWHSHWVVR